MLNCLMYEYGFAWMWTNFVCVTGNRIIACEYWEWILKAICSSIVVHTSE